MPATSRRASLSKDELDVRKINQGMSICLANMMLACQDLISSCCGMTSLLIIRTHELRNCKEGSFTCMEKGCGNQIKGVRGGEDSSDSDSDSENNLAEEKLLVKFELNQKVYNPPPYQPPFFFRDLNFCCLIPLWSKVSAYRKSARTCKPARITAIEADDKYEVLFFYEHPFYCPIYSLHILFKVTC